MWGVRGFPWSSTALTQGLNVFRYGNRSPLLLNPESDVVTHKAAEIKYVAR